MSPHAGALSYVFWEGEAYIVDPSVAGELCVAYRGRRETKGRTCTGGFRQKAGQIDHANISLHVHLRDGFSL